MRKTIAYIRVSKDTQDIEKQRHEILNYTNTHKMHVDEFIDVVISSRQRDKIRRLTELKEKLNQGDTLIVTELSRLGRSTIDLLTTVKALDDKGVRIIFLKQQIDTARKDANTKIMLGFFAIFAEVERDFISIRTKEALAERKAKGIKLGSPKGAIYKSKFDDMRDKIIGYLAIGLKAPQIAKNLGLTSHLQLTRYIKTRNLKAIASNVKIGYDVTLELTNLTGKVNHEQKQQSLG